MRVVPHLARPTDPTGQDQRTPPDVPALHRALRMLTRFPVTFVAAVALAARLVAVITLGPLRPGVVVPDEEQYLALAESVASGRGADAWQPGYGQTLYDTTSAFMRPLTLLTEVFGEHQLAGQLLAATFGVTAAAFTTALALRVTTRPWAIAAGLVVALLPSQVFWSSLVLRESMVWSCLVAIAIAFAIAVRSREPWKLAGTGAMAGLALWALGDLRGQTAVVTGVALVGASLVVRSQRRLLIPAGAVAVALVAPYLAGLGVGGLTLVEMSVPRIGTLRTALSAGADSAFVERRELPSIDPELSIPSTGPSAGLAAGQGQQPSPGSGRGEPARPGSGRGPASADRSSNPQTPPSPDRGIDATSPVVEQPDSVVVAPTGERYAVDESATATLAALPRGLVAVTFRPFPWEPSSSTGILLARIENILWALLYGLALVGLCAGWSRRDRLAFPVLVSGAVVAVAAVTQGNLGTAFRHRGQVLWAVAILAAIGMEALVRRYTSRRASRLELQTVDVRS